MPQAGTPSGIFEWISRSCRVQQSDSATMRYERMESQANFTLPEVHQPLDHTNPYHWHHRGMIWDYVFSLEGAKKILDIGPGDGWPSLMLADHFKEVVGIDPALQRVDVCRENAKRMKKRNAKFEVMSACDMSFRPGSFDGIVAATSIEQTSDPAKALAEVFRVLKVGGTFRLSFEALEDFAEPVREAVSIQHCQDNTYLIDYLVAWTNKAEEKGYQIEVTPLSENSRKRFEIWAERCKDDSFPHRDPRLERGLSRTIKGIRKAEILSASGYTLKHFKTETLIKMLTKIGFTEIRRVAGGGWPAMTCAKEIELANRIQAAAPIMEEICRGAGRIGINLPTETHGQLIMKKRSARPAVKKTAAAKGTSQTTPKPAGVKATKKKVTKKKVAKKKATTK
jgi:ubiquinone/menaquinone biosynthesis C-methylase UbiE